jgi:ABC-type multidrug transport system permease subunit
MKAILIGTYYQLITFLRIKKALFFAFFFPSFVYIIFSLIWGIDNDEYQRFLLTGVIIMTTASDALFTIGGIINDYYQNGLIKFFKATPYSFSKHIICLILSRILIVALSSIIVFIIAFLIGKFSFSVIDITHIIMGIITVMIIFAMIGIIVAEITKEHSSNSGTLNIIFYVVIFLSDTFYPLTELNPTFNTVVLLNPITPALELARGYSHIIPIAIWITALTTIHSFYHIKNQLKR